MPISSAPHFSPAFVRQRILTYRIISWLRIGFTIGLIGWFIFDFLFHFGSSYRFIIVFAVPLVYRFLSDFIRERLRCPACQALFDSNPKALFCAACGLGSQGRLSEAEYKQQRLQYSVLYHTRQQAYEHLARIAFWTLFIGGGLLSITALLLSGQLLSPDDFPSHPIKWLFGGAALVLVLFLLGLSLYMQHKMRCPACNARISARSPTKYCPSCGIALT